MVVFHVELRQFPHVARAFNQTARIALRLHRGESLYEEGSAEE